MSLEREALIDALESLIAIEEQYHELWISVTAVTRAYRATAPGSSALLLNLTRAVREELAPYAPDARVRGLIARLQDLKD
jgi:hypothetical protein